MEGSPTASPTACARHRRSSWTTPGSIPQTYSSGENNNLKRGGGGSVPGSKYNETIM